MDEENYYDQMDGNFEFTPAGEDDHHAFRQYTSTPDMYYQGYMERELHSPAPSYSRSSQLSEFNGHPAAQNLDTTSNYRSNELDPYSFTYNRDQNPPGSSPNSFRNRGLNNGRISLPSGMNGPAYAGFIDNSPRDLGYSAPSSSLPVQALPRNKNGIKLRPVSELPDIYRGIFRFGVFNAVQSSCFETVMYTNENLVISAPTSSGKTVLFELAIIKILMSTQRGGPQCVYMAPTKALCNEKFNDWKAKFEPLGIRCCELTGDTALFGKDAFKEAKKSTIIVTTPEKWDSLTRNWQDNGALLSNLSLFLIDEVHILHETRGATLEVCVSRMKTRANPRFVLVSATAPNIEDVAAWIRYGEPPHPTSVFQFDESFRPCQITRHVYSFPRKQQNEFQFLSSLDAQLFPILQRHANNKPIVVFCPTRKSVVTSAEKIANAYRKIVNNKEKLPWRLPRPIERTFNDSKLQTLVQSGIGVHHAGLTLDDRKAVEDLYAKRMIYVIFSTSTLAVGVNMPAHTVVILGTKQWAGAWCEYSDIDIMQMIGRAGRPQFDKEGVAIIMCETGLETKYKDLISGQTVLESCLHKNLIEHIASEICLGTIADIRTAKNWLRNSFLFQRLQKNPSHYSTLGDKAAEQSWQERLDQFVTDNILALRQADLITGDRTTDNDRNSIGITELGEIMSKYYIRYSTMCMINALPGDAGLKAILEMICQADELADISRLRAEEKKAYQSLREQDDIRFPGKKVEKTADKVFLLIQAVLGGISLNTKEWKGLGSQPHMEATTVLRHVVRIAKAVVDVALSKKSGSQVKYGMELVRSLTAKAWEDRPVVLRQIRQIGEKSYKVLAQNGIATLGALRLEKPHRIEALLNRKSPFGMDIVTAAQDLPNYVLGITETNLKKGGGRKPAVATISVSVGLQNSQPSETKNLKVKGLGMTSVLVLNSDYQLEDFRRIPTKALFTTKTFSLSISFSKPSQSITVQVNPDNYAGLSVSRTYKPVIEAVEFPVIETRPPMADNVQDALGSDFWNISDGEMEEICGPAKKVVVYDVSKPHLDRFEEHETSSNPEQARTRLSTKESAQDSSAKLRPEKLPNGKYICRHTCKDKNKCRHMCCREGVEKPSRGATASSKLPRDSGSSNLTTSSINPQSSSNSRFKRATSDNLDNSNHVTSNIPRLLKQVKISNDRTGQSTAAEFISQYPACDSDDDAILSPDELFADSPAPFASSPMAVSSPPNLAAATKSTSPRSESMNTASLDNNLVDVVRPRSSLKHLSSGLDQPSKRRKIVDLTTPSPSPPVGKPPAQVPLFLPSSPSVNQGPSPDSSPVHRPLTQSLGSNRSPHLLTLSAPPVANHNQHSDTKAYDHPIFVEERLRWEQARRKWDESMEEVLEWLEAAKE